MKNNGLAEHTRENLEVGLTNMWRRKQETLRCKQQILISSIKLEIYFLRKRAKAL